MPVIAVYLVLWKKLAVTTVSAARVFRFGSHLLPELLTV